MSILIHLIFMAITAQAQSSNVIRVEGRVERAATWAIHSPRRIGTTPGRPFVFLLPVSGSGKIKYSAANLPEGLRFSATGVISGKFSRPGQYLLKVTVRGKTDKISALFTIVAEPHSLALTPPMGWNSWNVWGCNVDEQKIRNAADLLVSSGLAAHGFQYVNIDDCWMGERDAHGEIHPDKNFGSIQRLAHYVHGKGLKLGVYSSPGPTTCAGHAGSFGHEAQDAQTYARWGVDYLKYDYCSYDGDPVAPYQRMGQALAQVPRDIVYSLCEYGMNEVWKWGASVGGNLWRTTGDIEDSWSSLLSIGFQQSGLESHPGAWNDPDMLVVGAIGGAWGVAPHPTRLTHDEQYSHLTLWSMLAAPLLIGADLSQLDDFTLNLLTNDEVLAIDQDPLGQQARRISDVGGIQVWRRPLSNGATALALFNMNETEQMVEVPTLEFDPGVSVRDLWRHTSLGTLGAGLRVKIAPHGTALLGLRARASGLRPQARSPD